MNRKTWIVATVCAGILTALLAVAYSLSREPAAVDLPSSADLPDAAPTDVGHQASDIASDDTRVRDEIMRPGPAEPSTISSDAWSTRLWSASDHWQFVQEAVPAAVAGDARAQFFVAGALLDCKSMVSMYEARYRDSEATPEQLFETLAAEFHPTVPAYIREKNKDEFDRCVGFFDGDPPALANLPPREGGYGHDYWMTKALESGDSLARVQESLRLTMALDSLGPGARQDAVDKIRMNLAAAGRTLDPTTMFLLGSYLMYPDVGAARLEGPAWMIAACGTGFNCSVSNPIVGSRCDAYGLCSSGESIQTNMATDLGSRYGDAYARAQEIILAYERGDTERVVGELLDQLQVD